MIFRPSGQRHPPKPNRSQAEAQKNQEPGGKEPGTAHKAGGIFHNALGQQQKVVELLDRGREEKRWKASRAQQRLYRNFY